MTKALHISLKFMEDAISLPWNHLRQPDTKHPLPMYHRKNKITNGVLLCFK